MTSQTSQIFESYVPVYDAIPENKEHLKEFLTERLKEHANSINIRAIGWMLDEELLSGYQFIPSSNISGTSEQYRTVLRKVINTGALTANVQKQVAHGILVDVNFTLIDLWVSATKSTPAFRSQNINPNDVFLDSININITSPVSFDRSFAQILYIQEL